MPPPLTPGFVSGEDFAFAAPADSPKGVMTRYDIMIDQDAERIDNCRIVSVGNEVVLFNF